MNIFKAIVERIKSAILISASNQVEADFASRATEQKAELHRKAKEYDEEGLHELAAELRTKAGQIDVTKPLAVVLPGEGFSIVETQLILTTSAESVKQLPPASKTETKKKRSKASL